MTSNRNTSRDTLAASLRVTLSLKKRRSGRQRRGRRQEEKTLTMSKVVCGLSEATGRPRKPFKNAGFPFPFPVVVFPYPSVFFSISFLVINVSFPVLRLFLSLKIS